MLINVPVSIGELFDKKTKGIVSFIEDDICNSRIESSSKDLIVSWDTLEHLNNPQKAFEEIFRILKPGGYTFHEYNPFFSFNGGHSLCTLDFMWGHVRLSSADFQNYLKQFRPYEYDLAMRFYEKNLNRMTSNQIKDFNGKKLPSIIEYVPLDEDGNKTIIERLVWQFDIDINQRYFLPSYMKNLR